MVGLQSSPSYQDGAASAPRTWVSVMTLGLSRGGARERDGAEGGSDHAAVSTGVART